MKPQICAQIDELFVEVLNGYGQKECRSLGRVIEMASEDILRSCVDARGRNYHLSWAFSG
jgi:hypothetical protein